MWSDRLERIATCMDELENNRESQRKYKEPASLRMIIEVGEMDQLSELHRLIWEEQ
jgi:hypothetical protein